MPLEIRPAYDELDKVRTLFTEYTAMLGLDLAFQNYKDEFDGLPGSYGMPRGRLYIADYGGELAGCVALRPHGENDCEMKRLFVRPQFRGLQIGKALAEKIIIDARDIGYNYMVLDTIPSLESAIRLYKGLGFYETEPYCFNPVEGALFLRLDLQAQNAHGKGI